MHDLLIQNARTRASGDELVTIAVEGGVVTHIGGPSNSAAMETIDAKGGLVTESYVNGHLHLCKVYTLEMAGQDALGSYHGASMGAAMTAIEQAAKFKDKYDEGWILPNVRRACELALKHGNTHIRAFADVDPKARLEGVKALIAARKEFEGRVDLQVVAFPQDGVIRDPGAEGYVRQALDLGANVVGGIPWIEYTHEDEREHIRRMFDLAVAYDKSVSMLLDDVGDPDEKTLEMFSVETLKRGWQGRTTAQHCRAMALYEENYFRKIIALLKQAHIGLVSDPHTGPLHARVRDLIVAGIDVALGQDDIADAYYPFGSCNMLEVAFLAVHMFWMTTFREMDTIYDMVTSGAARVLGIKGHALKEGGNADLVVLEARDVYHAIWDHVPPKYVIRGGKIVAQN